MFERFSDGARRVVVLAQEEARTLQHNYIGTEHILLGILHEGESAGAEALQAAGIDLDVLAEETKALIGRGSAAPTGHIPFTPRAKKTLEFALRESQQLGNDYIGSEHILLGLFREGDGVGAQVLTARGLTLSRMREDVIRLLGTTGGERRAARESGLRESGYRSRVFSPEEILRQLRTISLRLAAIEAKLGIEESPGERRLRLVEAALAKVTKQKESAIEDQDFERAAALRDDEKRLLVSRREVEAAWLAGEPAAADAPPASKPPGEPPPAASA